jgi:hypothetical protein
MHHVPQPAQAAKLLDARFPCLSLQATDIRHISQVVIHKHILVEGSCLGQVPDQPLDLQGMVVDVVVLDRNASLGWLHVAGENPEGRGFPRAVRPQQPQDLPFADLETDVVNRTQAAVVLGQVLNLDHHRSPL